jgi:hypothetical protein
VGRRQAQLGNWDTDLFEDQRKTMETCVSDSSLKSNSSSPVKGKVFTSPYRPDRF